MGTAEVATSARRKRQSWRPEIAGIHRSVTTAWGGWASATPGRDGGVRCIGHLVALLAQARREEVARAGAVVDEKNSTHRAFPSLAALTLRTRPPRAYSARHEHQTICILGTGTMGQGIAQVTAAAGFPTRVHDIAPERVSQALAAIGAQLDKLVAKGKLERPRATRRSSAFPRRPTSRGRAKARASSSRRCPEDMALKVELLTCGGVGGGRRRASSRRTRRRSRSPSSARASARRSGPSASTSSTRRR